MDLLRCLKPQRWFQTIFLMITFNQDELNIKPAQYVLYIPKFALICTVFYLSRPEGGNYPIFMDFMNTTIRSLGILVPLIVYLTDFLVETKMLNVVRILLDIDAKFPSLKNTSRFVKATVFGVAILCTIECLIDSIEFEDLAGILSTILINVIVCRWIVYLHISGYYLENLNVKVNEADSPKTVKTLLFFHNELYFLFKNIELALSLNVFLAVVFGYLKVLWNFFKVVKHMDEGIAIYALFNGVLHFFPLLGTILPCMVVQRKTQKLRESVAMKHAPQMQKQIFTLSLQVLHQDIVFSPLQAFTLNGNLMMTMIGSFVTYLVILLQLQVL